MENEIKFACGLNCFVSVAGKIVIILESNIKHYFGAKLIARLNGIRFEEN